MDAVLCLCHFCELHGPSIVFSTQSFQLAEDQDVEELQPQNVKFFGDFKILQEYQEILNTSKSRIPCEACQSSSGYISNNYDDKISYLSTKLPTNKTIASLAKQAAVRSLSCEVVPGREGQIYFGDENRGHVISYTFFLKDAQARGFQRWYSIIVFMRDKYLLLNSWPFFQNNLRCLVLQLQQKAAQVHSNEQSECPQRAKRLSSSPESIRLARCLVHLTNTPDIFTLIHLWFTWLLSTGGRRLEEKLANGLRSRRFECRFVQSEVIDDGFCIVDEIAPDYEERGVFDEKVIERLKQLKLKLDGDKFISLLYCLLVGYQVVVRGPKECVKYIVSTLKFLLPLRLVRTLNYTDIYLTPDICNIIGLSLSAAVPLPTDTILRVDVVPATPSPMFSEVGAKDNSLLNHVLVVKWTGVLPVKIPTLVLSIDFILGDDNTNKTSFLQIRSLVEQWKYTGEVIKEVKKTNINQDLDGLLHSLGALEHDGPVVDFWSK